MSIISRPGTPEWRENYDTIDWGSTSPEGSGGMCTATREIDSRKAGWE